MTENALAKTPDVIHVAVIEDDDDLRAGLVHLLRESPATDVVGEYADFESAFTPLLDHPPDVVLVDIGLPGMTGIQGIKNVRAHHPEVDFIVLTIHERDDVVFDALRAGACGYLIKSDIPHSLVSAIQDVREGGAPMSTRIARKVIQTFRSRPNGKAVLTARETEVLDELCAGKSYRMIADSLFISEETVRRHLKSIYRKLEVHSKSAAVAKAFRQGLVRRPD